MSVQKYKTLSEAEEALWNFYPDDKYYDEIRALFNLACKMNPPNFPRGVFKYKTLEEANKQKMEWIDNMAQGKNTIT
ncbi:MAG: hypothetical protein D8M58_04425 [Calditrichaeota bacterium]|nr:MAG: hypothetical protein DWQ03_02650 [Calditrichota bacterium]MBL1204616.1 hypothetical protein [Calditrichota bacterium]NOG44445.1 hypothetical protein [Calditrichota bacterium]